ncbi:hypothetical protein S245_060545 [Arachis hypogaea]|nr:uncharacterized protein DS421_17g590690 [Arachis hypogaea]
MARRSRTHGGKAFLATAAAGIMNQGGGEGRLPRCCYNRPCCCRCFLALLFLSNSSHIPPLNFQNYYSTQYEFIVLLTVVANSRCCCPVKAVVSVANIGG